MPLTNTQLRYYDSNVLRLPDTKRKEYHEQVDRLITELRRSVRDSTEIKITRVVKAGSFAILLMAKKGSSLPFDIQTLAGLLWETSGTVEDRRQTFREHWEAVKNRPPLVPAESLIS